MLKLLGWGVGAWDDAGLLNSRCAQASQVFLGQIL
jgi:hypothetical protein